MDGGTEHRGGVGPNPKDEAESMRGLIPTNCWWLYGGMDPRSIHESYPPGSLDRNLLWTFVSESGSSGREICTHPKVAFNAVSSITP